MHVRENTLDDLLNVVLVRLLKQPSFTAQRGKFQEVFGAFLHLTNPRARFSRTEGKATLFSCLGELLWYLAKSDRLDFIEYYASQYRKESQDKVSIRSAYGPRLFLHERRGPSSSLPNDQKQYINQIEQVQDLLRERPTSRRAVIQLFQAEDGDKGQHEAPCTCTLQFVIRKNKLHMMTHMRSNDAFLGLPHDVFAFTMVQELLSRALGVGLGTYRHSVGSLHLYEKDAPAARRYLGEGWQALKPMPDMPSGDPWPSVDTVLAKEREIRDDKEIDFPALSIDPYWS